MPILNFFCFAHNYAFYILYRERYFEYTNNWNQLAKGYAGTFGLMLVEFYALEKAIKIIATFFAIDDFQYPPAVRAILSLFSLLLMFFLYGHNRRYIPIIRQYYKQTNEEKSRRGLVLLSYFILLVISILML